MLGGEVEECHEFFAIFWLCRKLFRFQLDGRCCRARLDVTGVRGGQNGDRIQRGALS